jgi:hypothetical protein
VQEAQPSGHIQARQHASEYGRARRERFRFFARRRAAAGARLEVASPIADKLDDASAGAGRQSLAVAAMGDREKGNVVRGVLMGNLFHGLPQAGKKNLLFEPTF